MFLNVGKLLQLVFILLVCEKSSLSYAERIDVLMSNITTQQVGGLHF